MGKIDARQVTLPMKRLNRILSMLLDYMKDLDDEGREHPIRWNIMHMYSSVQLAKILAARRGIEPELAGIAAALHDIGAVMTKKQEGHAKAGEKYAYEFIEKYNNEMRKELPEITEKETEKIVNSVIQHSDKEIISYDPFVELIKDVDSLDRYLHGVKTKGAHLKRCKIALKEIDLNML